MPRLFSATLKLTNTAESKMSKFEKRSRCLEDAGLKHKVGGWYFTIKEKNQLFKTLLLNEDIVNVPCRLRSMAMYFRDKENTISRGELATAKLSFRLTTRDLDDCEHRYKQRDLLPNFEKGRHASVHFLREILEQAEVKPADFIRRHCLALPSCHEHESCKEIHGKLPEHAFISFTCCYSEECEGEFNADNMTKCVSSRHGRPVAVRPLSELVDCEEEKRCNLEDK